MTECDATRLPRVTKNLDQMKSDLDEFGYAIVGDALSPQQAKELRDRLSEQAELEREYGFEIADHVYSSKSTNQWVYGLINKGRIFRVTLEQPVVQELLRHVVGAEYLLSDLTAHIVQPGSEVMGLHTDFWWMPPLYTPGKESPTRGGNHGRHTQVPNGFPEPSTQPIYPPMAANVMWMLCDFTRENGATRVVPRSHLSGQHPDASMVYESVDVEGSEGSALIWDARIWHSAGTNSGKSPRFGLVTSYKSFQLRPRVNFPYAIHKDVLEELSPEVRKLLAFESYEGLGHTDNPRSKFIKPGEQTVGELRCVPGSADPTAPAEQFWVKACEVLEIDPASRHGEKMIGDPEKAGADIVDGLAEAIRIGKKRGTAPLKLYFSQERLELPDEGDYWVIVNSKRKPVCVVQIERIETTPFNKINQDWAEREGEADGSFEYWEAIHRWYYRKMCRLHGVEWSEDAMVVLIYFDTVFPKPL